MTIEEPVIAPDAFAEDEGPQGPGPPKKLTPQYLGELDMKFNNEAASVAGMQAEQESIKMR
jgi:hypothetical protein